MIFLTFQKGHTSKPWHAQEQAASEAGFLNSPSKRKRLSIKFSKETLATSLFLEVPFVPFISEIDLFVPNLEVIEGF